MRRSEKSLLIQQVPFRMHINDYKLLRKLLTDEGMSFQAFVDSCVQAYLRGDPATMKIVRDYKDMNTVPKEVRAQYNLSHRERDKILDELEVAGPVGKR